MNEYIKNIVSAFPLLEYKRNEGEDRIRKSGVKKGSLWVSNRYKGFRLQTTGEIASILDEEIEELCGKPVGEEKPQAYKYWYVDDYHLVKRIIEFLGKS